MPKNPTGNQQNLEQQIDKALKSTDPSKSLSNLIVDVEKSNKMKFKEEDKISFEDLKKQIEKKMRSLNLDAEKQKAISDLLEKKAKESKDVTTETGARTEDLEAQVRANAVPTNPDNGTPTDTPADDSGTGIGEPSDFSFFGSIWNGLKNAGGWLKDKWNGLSKTEKGVVGGIAGIGGGILTILGIKKLKNRLENKKLRKTKKTLEKRIREYNNKIDNEKDADKLVKLNQGKKVLEERLQDINEELGEESDDKETSKSSKEKKKPRYKRLGTRLGIGAVGTAVGYAKSETFREKVNNAFGTVKDWVVGLFSKEKPLSFEEAKERVENEIKNNSVVKSMDAGNMGAHFTGLEYDESNKTLSSFNEKIEIDPEKKKIKGLDIEFKNFKELLHAASLINFLRATLKGRGVNDGPFSVDGSDIKFSFSNEAKKIFTTNSDFWKYLIGGSGAVVGGILGWYGGKVVGGSVAGAVGGSVAGGTAGYIAGKYADQQTDLGRACATIADDQNNLDRFLNFLNGQKDENSESLWTAKEYKRGDEKDNGLMVEVNDVIEDIVKTYGATDVSRRGMKGEDILKYDESKPNEFDICSYGKIAHLKIEMKDGKTFNNKNKPINYDDIKYFKLQAYDENKKWSKNGLNIEFPNTKEGLGEVIRTANLLNQIQNDWKGKGGENYPFVVNCYQKHGNNSLEIDIPGLGGKTIVKAETLREKYPTVFEDLKKSATLSNSVGGMTPWSDDRQRSEHDRAIRDLDDNESQTIKFLHQIGEGNYRKSAA